MGYKINLKLTNTVFRTYIPPLVKGDSFDLEFDLGEDITDWKIRCEIYDRSNKIQLATANTGGSNTQIAIIGATDGKFTIFIPKDSTTDFTDKGFIEIEVETDDVPSKKKTILQQELKFKSQRIDWSEPD